MNDPDASAFLHYDDLANREPAPGTPRRRLERALTRDVPVRFPAETIEVVDELARAEGVTVSAWIRRAVDVAIREPRGRSSGSHTE
jgi:Ribbon-helix-helix protein, copG family